MTVEGYFKEGGLKARRMIDVGYDAERMDLELLRFVYRHVIVSRGEIFK